MAYVIRIIPAVKIIDPRSTAIEHADTSAHRIEISMDGKRSWRDNVFVERLWRSVKYEEVYLNAYDSVADARAALGRYFDFYNGRRPHSSHGGRPPDQAYFDNLP